MPRRDRRKPLKGIYIRRNQPHYADVIDLCDFLGGFGKTYSSPTYALYRLIAMTTGYHKNIREMKRFKAEHPEWFGEPDSEPDAPHSHES